MKSRAVRTSPKKTGTVSSSQKRSQPSRSVQSKPGLYSDNKSSDSATIISRSYDKPKEGSEKQNEIFETSITYWLGSSFKSKLESDFDVIDMGEQGITKASIDDLTSHIGITRKTMAEDVLGMSVKTLERKTPKEKLNKQTSSHAIEIAKIMQHAYEVFEDEEKVKRWMNKENRALNNLKPVMFLGTLTGINMVNDILGRIQEGVYS
jgi:putative toxin-antitoxin system antitoxin component (TIGR02293 family)